MTNEAELEPADDALWIEVDSSDPASVVQRLLDHAVRNRVSDLFFCAEERYTLVAARHLGILQRITQLSSDLGKRCVAHIKGLSGMDVTERRRPQDGRWIFHRPGGAGSESPADEVVDLRLNTLPTLYGEDCTMRLLDRQTRLLDLDRLGLIRRDFNHLVSMLSAPAGLILVTGPTGSGKTTTLYACLNHLNNGSRKINTIEDPVEYALASVRQSQVNAAIDLGFAEILRSVLRQAPDVIMVGEIRDVETATTAVRAANSGHLVLATMHAPIAAAAVQALLNLNVHPHHLASCLLGVVAQRLVRTLNPDTRVSYDSGPMSHVFTEVKRYLEPGQGDVIYGPGPQSASSMPYVGRTGVFEVMSISPALRSLIAQAATAQDIRHKAIEEGMIGVRQAALLAVARGMTSVEEVFRVVPAEFLLE
jgi:type II secretory ATPase GspE/PulE/Tfp pilus assembly ATPase PilB-like protein